MDARKKKRKIWAYLLLLLVMPFTAFMELEKLFSDDGDLRDMDDDPELGKNSVAIDTTPEPEPTRDTAHLDKE